MPKRFLTPWPGKQTEMCKTDVRMVFGGGARAGTKTWSGIYKAAYQARTWHYADAEGETITKAHYLAQKKRNMNPQIIVDTVSINYSDYRGLIIRRTHKQIDRNIKPECDELYLHDPDGNPFARWLEKKRQYIFPSGATVTLVHCRDRTALDDYIGGNNHFAFVDEANQFYWEWIQDINSSLRSKNSNLKPQLFLASNPGNKGHYWLLKRFVERCRPIPIGKPEYNKEFEVWIQEYKTAPPFKDKDDVEWQFIPSTVFDNPSLLQDRNYVNDLKAITNPAKRAMWLEGKWDAPPGLFFNNFNHHNNVIRGKFVYGEDFNKQTHDFYRFIDYGTKAPTAVLFAAVEKKTEDMVVFDELIMQDGELIENDEIEFEFHTSAAPSIQAKMILAYTRERHPWLAEDDFEDNIADSQMWQKTSEKDEALYSPAELFEDAGLMLTSCGKKDRKVEAAVVYNGFDKQESGIPKIRFTENCIYSTETIPTLPSKENDVDDVDTDSDDHAFDALKYGAKYVFGVEEKEDPRHPEEDFRKELEQENDEDTGEYSWKVA